MKSNYGIKMELGDGEVAYLLQDPDTGELWTKEYIEERLVPYIDELVGLADKPPKRVSLVAIGFTEEDVLYSNE